MTDSAHTPPTAKQMRYLRQLATQSGETFAYPTTFAQASREIDRLRGRKRSDRRDVIRERRDISRDLAENRGGAARVRDDELRGYGSSARWTNSPDR